MNICSNRCSALIDVTTNFKYLLLPVVSSDAVQLLKDGLFRQRGDVCLSDLIEGPLVGPELQYRLFEAGGLKVANPAAVRLGVARGHAKVRYILEVLLAEVLVQVPGLSSPIRVPLPGLGPPFPLCRLSPPPFLSKRFDELVNIQNWNSAHKNIELLYSFYYHDDSLEAGILPGFIIFGDYSVDVFIDCKHLHKIFY